MTSSCILDYNTVAAADKFGNVAVVCAASEAIPCHTVEFFSSLLILLLSPLHQVRLPQDVTDEVDEDPTGSKAVWDRGLLSGASQKVGNPLLCTGQG